MPYFLTNQTIELGQNFFLNAEEARHLTLSRRVKINEIVILQDLNLNRFQCRVVKLGKREIELVAVEKVSVPPESNLNMTLLLGYISENALDSVLTKSVELGVKKIIVFQADYSPANLLDRKTSKLERWNKILVESCKQSMRGMPPVMEVMENLEEALNSIEEETPIVMLDFVEPKTHVMKIINEVCLVVGPEGGFSQSERNLSKTIKNLTRYSLGNRVLKAETAAIAAMAIFQHNYGDLRG